MDNKRDVKKILVEQFDQFENALNGQSQTSLHQVRKAAMASFEKLGLPDKSNEFYKYSTLAKALNKEFDFSDILTQQPTGVEGNLDEIYIEDLEAHVVVLIDGKFSEEHSRISTTKGLEILSFNEAYKRDSALVETHFAKYADDENDAYTAMNTAFFEDGIFIKIDNNSVIEKPIVIYHIADNQMIIQTRNLMLVGKSSQVDIVENYIAMGEENNFSNVVSEIVLEENATVNHYKLQLESKNTYHVGNTQVYQTDNSNFTDFTISLQGQLLRNNLNVISDGEYCETNMYGLYLPKGKQNVDNYSVVDHKKPNSCSNELYKGILAEKSTGTFNGKIYVRQAAQKTNAFQSNKNILLSDDATINTKPQLEIWADDVKCSHGTTTGQLDNEQMFYLRSRGLSKESARSMLLYAFALEVVENIKIEPLKKYIDKHIYKIFNQ